MSYLKYIDDEQFKTIVKDVLEIGRTRKKDVVKKFNKNVIDPFATLFDSAVSGVDHKTWKNTEMVRQCQKTLTNHIGNLHQKILGCVAGWQDLGVGGVVDLVNHDKKVIAEVKNKYNTVTGGKLAEQYYSLERLITPKTSLYKGYRSYFVNIIPKKPLRYDVPFTPSDKEKGIKCHANKDIRIIDGASFYALVTGRINALDELYDALVVIIENIYRTDYGEANFMIPDKTEFKKYFKKAYKG